MMNYYLSLCLLVRQQVYAVGTFPFPLPEPWLDISVYLSHWLVVDRSVLPIGCINYVLAFAGNLLEIKALSTENISNKLVVEEKFRLREEWPQKGASNQKQKKL